MAYRKMTCPECSKVLRPAKPVPAGKKVRCPECETIFYPEDAIDPVEADEDEPRGRSRRPEPAKKAGAKPEPAKKADAESETYGYVKEEESDDDKPKISYAPDTSIKDLRGPAQAQVMSPSNYLTLAGFLGVGGWMTLLILLMIPALFPLKPDDTKKRPVLRIKAGLSNISTPARGGGGGGFPGGFTPPQGTQGKQPPKIEEEKAGFYDIGGFDIAFITDFAWYWFLISLIPLLFCLAWSATVSFGAIQMQNLESRGWGIAASILAMVPINAGGVMIVTALVVQILLIQVIDDTSFILYVVIVLCSILWLLSVATGVWSLVTLMNEDVIAGYEYEPE